VEIVRNSANENARVLEGTAFALYELRDERAVEPLIGLVTNFGIATARPDKERIRVRKAAIANLEELSSIR
jgi:HEAT repeat protein